MSRSAKILISKLILCVILLGWLFSKTDLSQFKQILASFDLKFFIISYILLFINTSLSALKWRILLKSDGVDIPFSFLLQSYLVATFANMFLPSNIGGDVVRIYDVAKAGKDATKSFASVFMDRASGFFALATIGFIASVFGYSLIQEKKICLGLLCIFAFIFVSFIGLFNKRIHTIGRYIVTKIPVKKIPDLFEKLISSFNAYKNRKSVLVRILGIAFCFQFLVVLIVDIYSLGLGYDVDFLWFLIFIPVISVIESVPLTPYALGIRDMSYVFFFTKAGMTIEQAMMLSLTYVVMTFLYALPGGIVFIFRKKYKNQADTSNARLI